MTQDIKQQIEVMQHYAAGGEVESKFIAARDGLAEWKHNHTPEFDWVHFNYRIVGPSRDPFGPIQHMKDGCIVEGLHGTLYKYDEKILQSKNKSHADSSWTASDGANHDFICLLIEDRLQPYQEPEKPVVWRCKDSNEEFCVDPNFSFTGNTSFTRELVAKFIEIAQGKWERVDG